MRDLNKLCRVVEDELEKIANNGLDKSNLEIAYKLIDMYTDIKNTEYWDTKCEYYLAVLREMRDGDDYSQRYSQAGHYDDRRHSRNDGYDRGSSYARRVEHYVRGHYSRSDGGDHYDEYMDNKHSYRNGDKSADCKQRMLDALERHMDKLTDEIGEMSRDVDCTEEKRVIEKYMDKLKRMM